ncbi:MAG TPA: ATP-grasp fold amidoligase family protein [Sphingomicrobium sp.]|nr:ATP-grasp fold amidoligase family protein [Sphingomicrobium sp.]
MNALPPALEFLPLTVTHQSRWAMLRVAIIYRWRHGRWPRLKAPELFTEWVQWRKLNDRDHGLARLTDKLHSKSVAIGVLGEEMVVPTLWEGNYLPDEPPARFPLILKANHGCRQNLVIRTAADWPAAKAVSRRWLNVAYGKWLDEWHYGAARRTLLIEPLIGDGHTPPVDYKIYVFGGRAEIVQVHEDRAGRHRWAQIDRDWRRLSRRVSGVPRPVTLTAMLAAAEALAAGRDFLRVDFYEVDGQVLFGEFCLFPGSGLDPFDPIELDAELGRKWANQR